MSDHDSDQAYDSHKDEQAENPIMAGPWRWSGVGPKGSKRLIFKATGTTTYPIATVALDQLDRFGTGDTDAMARLIAASPDLLAACQQAIGFFRQSLATNGMAQDQAIRTLQTLVDAVKKAEGS